ncbi:MAG: LPS-assembly protein LptD, partial [Paludibacteraceae bacterium]|nr:LPS-assembly protein LptD [Paludibacteraceae bacterium]
EVKSYDRKLSHDLRLDGRISFTPKWNFSMSMSYDITNNKITYTSCQISRDLHCWQMSLGFVPFGLYRSYNFYIGVKASMLRDLKLEKRSDTADNYIWR